MVICSPRPFPCRASRGAVFNPLLGCALREGDGSAVPGNEIRAELPRRGWGMAETALGPGAAPGEEWSGGESGGRCPEFVVRCKRPRAAEKREWPQDKKERKKERKRKWKQLFNNKSRTNSAPQRPAPPPGPPLSPGPRGYLRASRPAGNRRFGPVPPTGNSLRAVSVLSPPLRGTASRCWGSTAQLPRWAQRGEPPGRDAETRGERSGTRGSEPTAGSSGSACTATPSPSISSPPRFRLKPPHRRFSPAPTAPTFSPFFKLGRKNNNKKEELRGNFPEGERKASEPTGVAQGVSAAAQQLPISLRRRCARSGGRHGTESAAPRGRAEPPGSGPRAQPGTAAAFLPRQRAEGSRLHRRHGRTETGTGSGHGASPGSGHVGRRRTEAEAVGPPAFPSADPERGATGRPEPSAVPPLGDAELCALSPGLRGKGQSSAAFSEPARTLSSSIAGAPVHGMSEVRGWLRRSGGALRGAARGWTAPGAERGRRGGGSGAAPSRRAGPQLGRGSPRGDLASQKRKGEGGKDRSPRPTRAPGPREAPAGVPRCGRRSGKRRRGEVRPPQPWFRSFQWRGATDTARGEPSLSVN